MQELKIATGGSRTSTKWKNERVTWADLIERLQTPTRTPESVAEFWQMSKPQQDSLKDVGGFVGGHLREGKRRHGHVLSRSIIALDADEVRDVNDFLLSVIEELDCAFVAHSTRKHTPENPRLRVFIPLARDVTADEYEAVARMIVARIGSEPFDRTTFDPTRLMYWPSVSRDGEYLFERVKGKPLNPDRYLALYDDPTDVSTWPTFGEEVERKSNRKIGDPTEKPGLVGAFCRAYPITEAIETFLSDVYTPADEGRYTYKGGQSSNGLVVYDSDHIAFSNHATDPACGHGYNAFDLVRVHLFGDRDKDTPPDTRINALPSYKAMMELARTDETTKLHIHRDTEAAEDFTPITDENWQAKLEVDKNGIISDSIPNQVLILRNDKGLKEIRFNEFAQRIEVRDNTELPWRQNKSGWSDSDDSNLREYLQRKYGIYSPNRTRDALIVAALQNGYHPWREYLAALPEWDGEERIDTVTQDYLGSEDNPFVRAINRIMFVALVARILKPGTKYDLTPVWQGPQGIGKSMLAYRLSAGLGFTDTITMADMHDKAAAEKLIGNAIAEIGELGGKRKVDVDLIKAFVSRTSDKYRPPYGKVVEEFPRQCIMIATTNDADGFLRDASGNRRFAPIYCTGEGPFKPWDLDKATVDQMWAEALVAHAGGQQLYLTGGAAELGREIQQTVIEVDDRTGIVQEYLETPLPRNWDRMDTADRRSFLADPNGYTRDNGKKRVLRDYVSYLEIWVECFGNTPSSLTKQESYALRGILASLVGWEQTKDRVHRGVYGRQRVWKRTS